MKRTATDPDGKPAKTRTIDGRRLVVRCAVCGFSNGKMVRLYATSKFYLIHPGCK